MDFLGATTNTEMIGTVVNGVQTTAPQLYLLFAFLGIVLAFVIASYVVTLIRDIFGANDDTAADQKGEYLYASYNRKDANIILDIAGENSLSTEKAERIYREIKDGRYS